MLVITGGTAALHVKNAFSKLGFTSRAQLAAWSTRQHARRAAYAVRTLLGGTVALASGSLRMGLCQQPRLDGVAASVAAASGYVEREFSGRGNTTLTRRVARNNAPALDRNGIDPARLLL
jgi:hypothetical protein